jgi:hypothetical protein
MAIGAKLKRVVKELPHGTAPANFKGVLVDKGERYAAAFAFGAAKGYYGDRWSFKGYSADIVIGGGLLVASAFSKAFGVGTKLASHAERIGDAGIMSALTSIGAKWGLEKAGASVHLSHPKSAAAPLPAKPAQVVGHIPAAMGGNFLTPEQIAHYASRR